MSAQSQGKVIKSVDANTSSELHSLNLSQILQTTLDVYDLIKRFHQALLQKVPHHSFHYHHIQTNHGLDIGARMENQANYELIVQGTMLGEIYLTRENPFSPSEVSLIEDALSELVYPLRNAISYHEAVKNSYTCALTQVGNRAAYNKAINREMDFAKRHGTPFSLILIDIDKFKSINDSYGHNAGDEILLAVANLIVHLNRNTDNLFRYGGEEFALILSHTPLQGANTVAMRLLKHIEHTPFEYEGKHIPITISAGLSSFMQDDTPEKIFKRADLALYKAKQLGRNTLCQG